MCEDKLTVITVQTFATIRKEGSFMDRTGKNGTQLANSPTVLAQIAKALKECGIDEKSVVYQRIIQVAPILEDVALGYYAENGLDLITLAHACILPLFADTAITGNQQEKINLTNAYLGSHFLAYSFIDKDAFVLKEQVLSIWTGVLTLISETVRTVEMYVSRELYISPEQRLGPVIGSRWPGLALGNTYPFFSPLGRRHPFSFQSYRTYQQKNTEKGKNEEKEKQEGDNEEQYPEL
jgi:hypothetical protein